MSPGSSDGAKKNSRKPIYSRFTQQELPAWKPILTQDGSFQYSSFLPSSSSLLASSPSLHQSIYVKSRSDKQLCNKEYKDETKDCFPLATINNDYSKPIVPCGLITWSLFNDTNKFAVNNKDLEVDKKDITWKSNKEYKFGSDVFRKNFQTEGMIGGGKLNESIPLSEQDDLIVWMRTAEFPTFRKLYGKIIVDLEANNDITVVIQNNFNTYEFGGKKLLVLSTRSWIGGKNSFLGGCLPCCWRILLICCDKLHTFVCYQAKASWRSSLLVMEQNSRRAR